MHMTECLSYILSLLAKGLFQHKLVKHPLIYISNGVFWLVEYTLVYFVIWFQIYDHEVGSWKMAFFHGPIS